MVDIVIRHLTESEIYDYISVNDQIFIPSLSSRLEIKNFAVKLNKYAVHFCATEKERLVGFTGCYFNDPAKKTGFISTLSVVSEIQGKKVAGRLLKSVINYGIINEFKQIRLHVYISNLPAIRLYSGHGFFEVSRNINQLEMVLNLQKK
jgi:ribosomal protein S18 acetylase RimI-like enzyme